MLLKTLALTGLLLTSFPAQAQQQQQGPPCAARSVFLNHLFVNYKEVPVAMGLTANGGLLEVVASESGSWTIIVTQAGGSTCGVASGRAWSQATVKGRLS